MHACGALSLLLLPVCCGPPPRLIDQEPYPLARLLILDLECSEVDLRDIELLEELIGELGPLIEIGFDGSPAEHEANGLAPEEFTELFVPCLTHPGDLLPLEGAEFTDPGAPLLLEEGIVVATAKDLDIDDRSLHPRWDLERRVLHILSLLTEDRGEELLLRGELGLTLRGDLTDEDITRLDPSTDPNDTALIELDEALLGDLRVLACDLLHPPLRIPDLALQLLASDRSECIILDEALADDDRILEVVPIPGHEGDEDIPAEGELAMLGRGTIGDHLARLDLFTDLD